MPTASVSAATLWPPEELLNEGIGRECIEDAQAYYAALAAANLRPLQYLINSIETAPESNQEELETPPATNPPMAICGLKPQTRRTAKAKVAGARRGNFAKMRAAKIGSI
jgi:hypothetical protein